MACVRQPRRLLLLAAVLLALLAARSADGAGASITLRARWQGTPYLLEAAEFLVSVRAGRAQRPRRCRTLWRLTPDPHPLLHAAGRRVAAAVLAVC
jgi:hypothetical protein